MERTERLFECVAFLKIHFIFTPPAIRNAVVAVLYSFTSLYGLPTSEWRLERDERELKWMDGRIKWHQLIHDTLRLKSFPLPLALCQRQRDVCNKLHEMAISISNLTVFIFMHVSLLPSFNRPRCRTPLIPPFASTTTTVKRYNKQKCNSDIQLAEASRLSIVDYSSLSSSQQAAACAVCKIK